jgi:hypothetical protein
MDSTEAQGAAPDKERRERRRVGQLAIFGAGVTAVFRLEIVLAVPYSAAPQLQNTAEQHDDVSVEITRW